ncbi:DUF192 domain-containing protein [Candidatus Daviesbacteria bacterium]|nr:DUF192 domain-containing protein [Candidatus Daviesbacteria bacterium]
MKKFLFQSILLLIIIGVALFFFMTGSSLFNLPFFPQESAAGQLQINEAKFKVEIADTQAERSKGLGGRQSLASDEGMLFIFPEVSKYPFWMKGLKFPLDFIWIRGEIVVDITENAKPPKSGQPDSELPMYQSKVDIDKVLEIPAGSVQKYNIKAGDIIKVT